MAVWTERSSTDKASLTKMKMMLSWGRSEEYDMFLHLRRERDGGKWRGRGVGGGWGSKQRHEENHLETVKIKS